MTPQSFEAIAESNQETIQMHDERIAAQVLDKTLSMIHGTELQIATSNTVFQDNPDIFSRKTELPDLNTQENGIPDNHDCTQCVVHVEACALLQAAKDSSPFADRLSVVSQLSKHVDGFKDLPKDQVESLIKEGMSALKAKREALETMSASKSSSPVETTTSQQSELIKEPEAVVHKPQIPEHILKMRQGMKPQKPVEIPEPISISSRKENLPVQPENNSTPSDPQIVVHDIPAHSPEPQLIAKIEVTKTAAVPQEVSQPKTNVEIVNPAEPLRIIPKVIEPPSPQQLFVAEYNNAPLHTEKKPVPSVPHTLVPSAFQKEPIQNISYKEPTSSEVYSKSVTLPTEPEHVDNKPADESEKTLETENVQYFEEEISVVDITDTQKNEQPVPQLAETGNDDRNIQQTNDSESTQTLFQYKAEIIDSGQTQTTDTLNINDGDDDQTVIDPSEKLEDFSDSYIEATSPEIVIEDTLDSENADPAVINIEPMETSSAEIENTILQPVYKYDTDTVENSESTPPIELPNELIATEPTNGLTDEVPEITKETVDTKTVEPSIKEIKIFFKELPQIDKNKKQNKWTEFIKSNKSLTQLAKTLDEILLQLFLINNPALNKNIDFEKMNPNSSLLYHYLSQKAADEEKVLDDNKKNPIPPTYSDIMSIIWNYANILINFIPQLDTAI